MHEGCSVREGKGGQKISKFAVKSLMDDPLQSFPPLRKVGNHEISKQGQIMNNLINFDDGYSLSK